MWFLTENFRHICVKKPYKALALFHLFALLWQKFSRQKLYTLKMARFACSVVFFCDGILAYCEQKSAIMCVKLTILSTLVSAFICLGSEEHQRKQNALSVTRNIQRAYTCTGGRIQPIRVVPTGKRFAYLFRIIQYAVNIELPEIAKLSLLLYTPIHH